MNINWHSNKLFLLVFLLIILIASGGPNTRLLFVILLAILALGATGQLEFLIR